MRTKSSFFEEAMTGYRREFTKRSLKEGFERAARDADIMLELVEWGMDDYKLLSYSRE